MFYIQTLQRLFVDSPSSLLTKASVWTLSQNLYVSQHTITGTLYDLATSAISEVPTLDIT